MEKQHALQQLEQLQKKLYAIHYACSAMNLDADTVAPKNTSEGRVWRWVCWQARSSSS